MSRTGHIPGPPIAGSDPLYGDIPRISTSRATADSLPPSPIDPAEQMADTIRTAWTDHTLDGDRVLARPARGVGFVQAVTVESLRTWGHAALPAWRQLDDAGYARVVDLHLAWVRRHEGARIAGLPADQRRANELAAERRADDRRAELLRQRAAADTELAELDAGTLPTELAAPTRTGWLRRTPTP